MPPVKPDFTRILSIIEPYVIGAIQLKSNRSVGVSHQLTPTGHFDHQLGRQCQNLHVVLLRQADSSSA